MFLTGFENLTNEELAVDVLRQGEANPLAVELLARLDQAIEIAAEAEYRISELRAEYARAEETLVELQTAHDRIHDLELANKKLDLKNKEFRDAADATKKECEAQLKAMEKRMSDMPATW